MLHYGVRHYCDCLKKTRLFNQKGVFLALTIKKGVINTHILTSIQY